MGYPSMGSWVTYGLGSESENLPAYVVMPQPEGTPEGGTPCWGAGFLPAVYQGTVFRGGPAPIINLKPPEGMTPQRQRHTLDFLQKMNAMDTLDGDTEMAARISSYELAFRMRVRAPEAVDLAKESAATRKLYGIDQKHTAEFGTRCLLARRLVERGVRFVQLYSGGGPVSIQWDAHKDLVGNHEKMCGMTDQPVAGADAGPEVARAARFDAGDLGRGIRPAPDVARRRRAGPQSARVHDVVRRRRREGGVDRR